MSCFAVMEKTFKMPKKSKLATPEWILHGYDSIEEYNKKNFQEKNSLGFSTSLQKINSVENKSKGISKEKKSGKTFKIKTCPECNSDDIGVVLSGIDSEEESNTGSEWKCRKCKWVGEDVVEKELNEEDFMKYLDEKGEEVA